MTTSFNARGIIAAASLAAVSLTGCAGYDVELKGGLFDVTGLSSIGKKKAEPKLKRRNGLVVPPTTASLPVPGSGPAQAPPVAVAANGEAWPVDPERDKSLKKAAVLAQHKAFCTKARQRHQAGLSTTVEEGPLGSCEESILRNITGKRVTEARPTKQ